MGQLRTFFFGPPKDVRDSRTFHAVSLVAMLAWVGLGADGLSSSAYGPDEAFRALVRDGNHASLAVGLAIGTALTVFIIAYGYTRIIEHFPSGGGGYVVATKLLGPRFGVVSGSALLVDYVLTITVSIASGGDQVFNLIPRRWFGQTEMFDAAHTLTGYAMPGGGVLPLVDTGTWIDPVQRTKIAIEIGAIVLLTILNIRGVKESVQTVLPIFLLFVATHVVALGFAIFGHLGDVAEVARHTSENFHHTLGVLGVLGTLALFVRAYSLGGGTYTGIEAVSNGIQIMREPKVRTAKRTMMLMAISLAVTAGGIILAYLLVGAMPPADQTKTMNWAMLDRVTAGWHIGNFDAGYVFVMLALASEAGLLFVAAQAGFVDGPRVMANMAVDSWLPHRFAALSERLSMRNGVVLMSTASVLALLYTHGDVGKLVVMYSINVFLTFSLSNLGMTRFWVKHRKEHEEWLRHVPIHVVALGLCLTILVVTCFEKFAEGGWLTLVITGALVALCFWIRRHYARVVGAIRRLDVELPDPLVDLSHTEARSPIDPEKPVAVLFVGGYGGLGRHALLTLLRMFPGHFQGVVFVSIAIVDSGNFKGIGEVHELEKRTLASLEQYKKFAATLEIPADAELSTGTEVAVEAEKLGMSVVAKYPRALFVAGQLLFEEDSSWGRVLHNETAFQIQRRLQHAGIPMIVLPVRLSLGEGPRTKTPSLAAATEA
ncbi:MAG TPA: APC family permease [Polyangiaceae bacterium]|jgi:amino acid transporter